jgi:hypothetical protein
VYERIEQGLITDLEGFRVVECSGHERFISGSMSGGRE